MFWGFCFCFFPFGQSLPITSHHWAILIATGVEISQKAKVYLFNSHKNGLSNGWMSSKQYFIFITFISRGHKGSRSETLPDG